VPLNVTVLNDPEATVLPVAAVPAALNESIPNHSSMTVTQPLAPPPLAVNVGAVSEAVAFFQYSAVAWRPLRPPESITDPARFQPDGVVSATAVNVDASETNTEQSNMLPALGVCPNAEVIELPVPAAADVTPEEPTLTEVAYVTMTNSSHSQQRH